MQQLGFPVAFSSKVIDYIEILDKKLELDLSQAPIEVKIVSSADGCSHMIGPFLPIFWNEATDKTFAGKEFEDLMSLNLAKTEKDWNHKIVLPEARKHLRAVISYYENKRASFLQVLSNSSAVPPCQTGTKITELEKRKSSWK